MTTISQNPVKFYKYSTKTQYNADSTGRDSTNGISFVADEKAIYLNSIKYCGGGWTGTLNLGDYTITVTDGIITGVSVNSAISQ